jgi:hypothetical protein
VYVPVLFFKNTHCTEILQKTHHIKILYVYLIVVLVNGGVPGCVQVLVHVHVLPQLVACHGLQEVCPPGPQGPGGLAQLTDPKMRPLVFWTLQYFY